MRSSKFNSLISILISSFSILIISVLGSCGGAGSTGRVQTYKELQDLVSSRGFEIENDWANPVGGSNVNLIGNPNFIRFSGDSVEVYLPYFGVRHSGGGYGTKGGIKYEGLAKKLNIIENETKKNIELDFEADQDGENLEFHIKLFANGSSFTFVNSSQRSTISYQGEFKSLPEEE